MSSMISSSIGGLGALGGGIAGQIAAGPYRGHAQGLIDTGVNEWQGLQVPSDLSQALNFQNYQSAGQLNPELQQYLSAAPSQSAAVKANPQLVNAQMQALQGLKQASQTGMTSADRARLNQIQQQMATQQEGARQQIMQNYAQRGQAGSSNQLLAELNASQNAAQNANQQGLQAAGQAQSNALNALSQYGGQAGQMNSQQYQQQQQAAQAADALNRFNVQNQIQQQAANVAAQNASKQFNLQNQQGVMNANTGLTNQDKMLQRQGEQQMFADAAQKAGGLSGATFTGANAYNNMGNQVAQGWSNIGQGAGQFLGGSGGGSGGGGGGGAGLMSMFMAEGGEVKHPNSLLYGSLTNDPDVAMPVYTAPGNQKQEVTTHGQASPWETGGGLAGSPGDSGTSLPSPGMDNTGNISPGAEMGDDLIGMLAAHGGQVHSLYMADGGEVPCYSMGGATFSNGGVAGVSTTSRGTYPSYQGGGHIPGKADVQGDSYANDKVHIVVSPGEIVIPRSVVHSEDPVFNAAAFVKKIMDKKKKEN